MVGHCCGDDAWIEDALTQLVKEAGYTTLFARQIVDVQTFALKCVEERFAYFLHVFFGCFAQVAKTSGVVLEKSSLAHLLFERDAYLFIIVLEDVLAELLYLGYYIPRFIVGNVLHNVLQNPLKHNVGGGEVFNQLVYRQLLNLIVIQSDTEVCGEVELASHVA